MNRSRFDFEKALAAWRRSLEHNRAFTADDVDELEQHLRDQVAGLAAEGLTEEAAFRRALREMGDHATAEAEYRKVYWGKLGHRGGVRHELRWRFSMLKNFVKTSLRSLRRRIGYTALNVLGLSVGMAACLLIGVYVHEETSFDRHHEQSERIYRVTNLDLTAGKQWAPIGPPVGAALAEHIPEIEAVVRFIPEQEGAVLSTEAKQFKESALLYADSSVFDVFTIPLQRGDSKTALAEPYTLVLTERMARKYFGQADPLGQILSFNHRENLRVTGVIRDLPPTTHLPFDFLISMSTFYARAGDWVDEAKTWSGFYTYVLLREGHTADDIEENLSAFINAFYEQKGIGPATDDRRLILQPLTRIHLHSHLEKELQPNGNVLYVRILGSMAVFLLLLAVINFVNLATARSAERAREVGVRKTLGAAHGGLIGQFLTESVLLVLAAFLVAYALAQALLPFFRRLSDKALAGTVLAEPVVLLSLLGLAVVLGVIAGSYPAFVLARQQPVRVLKGGNISLKQGTRLREGLVVAQFVVAIALLAGTAIIYQQMRFLTTTALGFDKEQLIDVRIGPSARSAFVRPADALKHEILRHPGVEAATLISVVPGERHAFEHFEFVERDQRAAEEDYEIRIVYGTDGDYVSTLGLKILYGRDFTDVHATDTTGAFLLNEAALRALSLTPEQAIGKDFRWINGRYTGKIVGIVEDFNYASLHHKIDPLVIPLRPLFNWSHLVVRVDGKRAENAIGEIKAAWDRLMPGAVFDYAFLDSRIDALYRSEIRMSRIVTTFSIVALFIACLGLFGLAAFAAEQRTKEVGIRKVLGANVGGLVALLVKNFMGLVGVAFIVAVPLAYFAMSRWLEDFAYRIEPGPGIFLLAGVFALAIALFTVSFQAIKAATADPIKSLRYE